MPAADRATREHGNAAAPAGPLSFGARLFSARGELRSAAAAGVLLATGLVLVHSGGAGDGAHAHSTGWFVGQALIILSLGIGLLHGGRAALLSLAERAFDIDVLMFLGAVLAAYLGEPAEGALLLFLFTLSGALEELAMERTTRAIGALHALMPVSAQRWDEAAAAAGGSPWARVAPEALCAGDRIRVLPGEAVPVDARVTGGRSAVNQASLTGESMPRAVRAGDEVFAGTLNTDGPLEARVLRPAAQSSLQKVLDLVTTAQQQRQPVQQLIDRVSQPYAVGVCAAALAAFLVFWLALERSASSAAYTAITLLIVASPCALIIATPTATLAAISRAARGGVLFKGGSALTRLARLRAVVFDKTGTLTLGRPRLAETIAASETDGERLLAVAAALEETSTHPLAHAIIAAFRSAGGEALSAEDVRNVPGMGLEGVVAGQAARLGSLEFVRARLSSAQALWVERAMEGVQHSGRIAIACVWGAGAAVFALADEARPGSAGLVGALHALGVRPVVMLTGDGEATAARLARELGLDAFHAHLRPEDKVARVGELKAAAFTGVIGDGVNDAPALAAADVSIAIGSIGSDAALESADIVLLADDLAAVPWALRLARRAQRTITINLVFALGAMALMALAVTISAARGVQIPLWMGVVGHEGGTLLVVAHSLVLLTFGAATLTPAMPPDAAAPAADAHGGENTVPDNADGRGADNAGTPSIPARATA
ncbi:N/A [soil metagenome]